MAKKVFIGVGHGGSDPGAVFGNFKEKELNLVIATACHSELIRHGVEARMSRTKDENDTLDEEIRECNAFLSDGGLAIDIHCNAGGGDGVEAFYHYGGGVGKTLAENILTEVVKIGQNSRGAKTRKWGEVDYYGFIRETKANISAVIVECAFVDNATDMKIIDTKAEQQAMGVAIAKGILSTLGVTWKPNSTASTGSTKPVINGFNIHRAADYLVIYTGDRGDSTGTNKWGAEVPLNEDGVATSAPVYGVGNMRIPAGGCVLSGHGIYATWLLNYVKKGAKIQLSVSIK